MARILMITYNTWVSDARSKRHAEALAQQGHSVDVICVATKVRGQRNGINVIWLPMPKYHGASRVGYLFSYLRFFALASVTAARLSLRQKYDLVIVCTMPDAAVLSALIPKLLGSKILLDIRDTMPELYRDKFDGRLGAAGARLLMLEERASAWLADRILAVHEPHAQRLVQSGIPREKIDVVLNSPNPEIFKPIGDLYGSPPKDDHFTLVFHGTVSRRLGIDTALYAIHELRDRIPQLRLRLLGTGDFWEAAQALCARLKLDDRVRFERQVPLEQLPAALSTVSAGLVPNPPSSATHLMLPVKLLEYAALGIPVITARLRTIEHFFPEDAVRYFEPGNVASLAAAIAELHDHPEYRARIVQRAGSIMTGLGWNAQRENLCDAVAALIKDAPIGDLPQPHTAPERPAR
ncbi:MAG: glycosyltransferase family 4 protein [Candidatus Binataceae bacterium]|nr:glycosyltransferase family 4 protein [Candidatus Binataceae bacterium]